MNISTSRRNCARVMTSLLRFGGKWPNRTQDSAGMSSLELPPISSSSDRKIATFDRRRGVGRVDKGKIPYHCLHNEQQMNPEARALVSIPITLKSFIGNE